MFQSTATCCELSEKKLTANITNIVEFEYGQVLPSMFQIADSEIRT